MIRWFPGVVVGWAFLLIQTTVGGMLWFTVKDVGPAAPDLLAIVAVFLALWSRSGVEVMLTAWCLGFALDLTTGGGDAAGSVLGPMSIGYSLGAGLIFRIREAFFRDKPLPQAILVIIFCVVAHGLYVGLQGLVAYRHVTMLRLAMRLGQVGMLAAYTAVLMVPGHWLLWRIQRWIITAPVGRTARSMG